MKINRAVRQAIIWKGDLFIIAGKKKGSHCCPAILMTGAGNGI
jgi:hypothetical protein